MQYSDEVENADRRARWIRQGAAQRWLWTTTFRAFETEFGQRTPPRRHVRIRALILESVW